MRVLVINLDRAQARLERISENLTAAQIAFERIIAVDGRAVPERFASQFAQTGHLLDGEVGCYASHMLAWELIVHGTDPWALVLEDDVHVPANLHEIMDDIVANAPRGWEVIKLSSWSKRGRIDLAPLRCGAHIVAYAGTPVANGATLVSRSGAAKLLEPRLRRLPVDADLARPWRYGVALYGVEPAPILQGQDSTFIGGARPNTYSRASPLIAASHTVYNFWLVGPRKGLALLATGTWLRFFGSAYRRRVNEARSRMRAQLKKQRA